MAEIRLADVTDIEEISIVLAKSWKRTYRDIVDGSYLDDLPYNHWANFLNSGMENNNLIVLVMEWESKIVGAAIICKTENPGECCLLSFYLLPEKIGQGYGTQFYDEIETVLKRRGFSQCVLEVLENNKRAIKFYNEHGFKATGEEVIAVLGDNNYICKTFKKDFSN